MIPARPGGRRRAVLRVALGLALLVAVLVLPGAAARLASGSFPPVPLELPLVLLALILAPRRLGPAVRALVVVLAGLLLFLTLADAGMQAAFARPFDPLLDRGVLRSGWHLLSGTIGPAFAAAAVLAATAGFAALLALLAWTLAPLGRLAAPARRRTVLACISILTLGGLLFTAGGSSVAGTPAAVFAADRARLVGRSLADLAAFRRDLDADPLAAIPGEALLHRLAGKDVIVAFVESYGRSVLEDPRYAAAAGERLASFEREIAAAGFAARSAWLTAPTVGGLSWLAHGTLLSGLWVDNQGRYDRLMASRRPSLNALFRQAGWRTVAVMPAITMDWPEAAYFGYDEVHAAADLGYRGAPFNWVTMPDQYTLAAFQRLERSAPGRRPVMAEIALISSHAPWTPVPDLLPWDGIGDGRVFTPQARAGDPPAIVWQDPDRVRAQYALSIDYALETLASYVRTHGDEDLVLVILGDHQPAPIITGPGASRDVPVHLVAADPAVFAASQGWGWTEGLRPAPDAPVWPMDAFRERFVAAFSRSPVLPRSAGGPPPATGEGVKG